MTLLPRISSKMEFFDKGNEQMALGETDAALDSYTSCIEADAFAHCSPSDKGKVYLARSRLLLLREHWQASRKDAEAVLGLDGVPSELVLKASFIAGKSAFHEGDMAQAVQRLQSALNLSLEASWSDAEECKTLLKAANDKLPQQTTAPKSTGESEPSTVPQISFDWYQSNTMVYITFNVGGIKREVVDLEMASHSIEISFPLGNGREYQYSFSLSGKIDPDASKLVTLPKKVELRLKKAVADEDWTDLEQGNVSLSSFTDTSRPSYPSSSKKHTNWDSVERSAQEEEKNENVEGDAALQKLFQDIYSKGNEETRRAMIKSFTESGGTVLSTNWSDVGTKKVDVQPPKGMEAKTYSEK